MTTITTFAACLTILTAAPLRADTVAIRVRDVSNDVHLNGKVTITIDSLRLYLRQTRREHAKFVLYLDWRPIRGTASRLVAGRDELQFDVERTAESRDAWNSLLADRSGLGAGRPIAVSVGYENDPPIPSAVSRNITLLNNSGIVVTVLIVGFIIMAWLILRDGQRMIREPASPGSGVPPLSLGRVQMATWFVIIVLSWIVVCVANGEIVSISETALALMGISAATGMGSVAINSGRQADAETRIQAAEQSQAQITARAESLKALAATAPSPAALAQISAETAVVAEQQRQIERELPRLTRIARPAGRDVIRDLLTDETGAVNLHRLQIVIWTIVLAVFFIYTLSRTLTMPEFNATLLALMGISGGTYVGFKLNERPK